MEHNLSDLRRDYTKDRLRKKDIQEPLAFFQTWLDAALSSQDISEPTAMILSTVSDKCPSARVVLLKGLKADGLLFFTNYTSKKAADIAKNPQAALLFYWMPLERQVRIEGLIEKIDREDSISYFKSRPFANRISALVSPQSQVIPNRTFLENRYTELLNLHTHYEPKCPDSWGGYILKPTYFEFWQGCPSRLHDRIILEKDNGLWIKKRLAP